MARSSETCHIVGMLDGILLDLDRLVVAPPAPPIVPAIERPYTTKRSELAEATLVPIVAQYASVTDHWLAAIDAKMAELNAFSDHEFLGQPDILGRLADLIVSAEKIAERRAKESTKQRKLRDAMTKLGRRSDPASARVYDRVAREMSQKDRRLTEKLLELALFARAIRAKIDPRSKGGPVFEDPDALFRYLRTETGLAGRD